MTQTLDALFQAAVAAIDSGDVRRLKRLLAAEPALVQERLEFPGEWLRSKVGDALDGFFENPYLLWFIAEDPVRNGSLPDNIAEVARTVVHAAKHHGVTDLQAQLDYALQLVCWSGVAPKCGVQIELIDALLDAGASATGATDSALVNGNVEAAVHLVERGALLTLTTAVGLGRSEDATRLAQSATPGERQTAFILAALHGNVDGIAWMLEAGIEINEPSPDLYSHATALHHAVWSGSLAAVQILVEAGANLEARDTANDGTPLDWAEYAARNHSDSARAESYSVIARYLRDLSGIDAA